MKGTRGGQARQRAEGDLRRLLLRAERPLRPPARSGLRDLQARHAGRAAPAAPDALRVPAGAPAPGRLGVSHGAGASGFARVSSTSWISGSWGRVLPGRT